MTPETELEILAMLVRGGRQISMTAVGRWMKEISLEPEWGLGNIPHRRHWRWLTMTSEHG
jgi:hypothetical protein